MAMTTARSPKVSGPIEARPGTVRIPRDRYTSPEFHRLEIDAVWKRVWQMACREDQVAAPGDFVEYTIGDQSVLILRGGDDRVRAFPNTCLHRGNRLVSGCGNAGNELRCRYHLWAYNLDGSLKDIPDRNGFPGVEDAECQLPEFHCDTWGGFVFVNFTEDPEPLTEFLGPLVGQLAPYHLEKMVPTFSTTTPISANWKVVVEAFLEVYHVMGIHPQLLPMLDDVRTTFENYETHSRMIVPFGVPSARIEDDVTPADVLTALLEAGGSQPMTDGDVHMDPVAMFSGMINDDGTLNLPEGMTVRDFIITMVKSIGLGQGLDYSGLTDDQMIDDWHYHIFPNLVFNTHAGNFLFFRIRPNGDDPNSCLFDIETYQWIADPEEARRKRATTDFAPERSRSFGVVIDQDLENLPGVQTGLRTSSTHDYITISDQETRIAKLHEVIDRHIGAYLGA